MSELLEILCGDSLKKLRALPDQSVQIGITSPPYWGLRDYKAKGQLGIEKTPALYVAKLTKVLSEFRRVLRNDGTLWLNLGDSYAGSWGAQSRGNTTGEGRSTLEGTSMLSARQIEQHPKGKLTGSLKKTPGLKPKDLVGIPWMVAFALRADGWWLRSEITWCKKVPMPESVDDRPTTATEKIFLFTKSPRYFYDADAVRNPPSESFANDPRWKSGSTQENQKQGYEEHGAQNPKSVHRMFDREHSEQVVNGSNMRNFWVLGPEPFPDSHFATFPSEIPKRAILAGTSARGCCASCGAPYSRVTKVERTFESGTLDIRRGPVLHTETIDWARTCDCDETKVVPCTVLDPFAGSGTTGMVALELGRRVILIELNPDYIKLIKRRCNVTPGLQLA